MDEVKDREKAPNNFQITGSKASLLNPLLRSTIHIANAPTPTPITPETVVLILHHARPSAAPFPAALLASLDPADWTYFEFHENMAARMDPHAGGLHELVFDRTPLGDEWTCFFAGASPQEMREFRTKGLWERHPTKPALWKYAEQAGNMVALTGKRSCARGK
ncbi:hypothetical protein B0J12DRAFT_741347 [Macrophomina phaseolina]|uniref:Uncharacterized protein n=1 Tax=Macrophomina phaseolina TaxID=35725 RepID=A0ABQ8G7Q2_9PEZI|nr:hypothetical protein B0J12DRAFT_741347 [Macrophomina phaseolina]